MVLEQFQQALLPFGKPLVVMRVGSHAYGLAGPDSDEDFRGVFLPNERYLLGLGVVEQIKVKGDDWVCHDFRQFVKLVLKLNPTILEMLYIDPLYHEPFWMEVRRELRRLITRDVFKPYSAYVRSQIAKALNRQPIGKRAEAVKALGFDQKFTSHCARLAIQCTGLLETGYIQVALPEPYRSDVLKIKMGECSKNEAIDYCRSWDAKMYAAYEKTCLPEKRDVETFEKNCYIPWIRQLAL